MEPRKRQYMRKIRDHRKDIMHETGKGANNAYKIDEKQENMEIYIRFNTGIISLINKYRQNIGQSLEEQQINNVHLMDNKINAEMQRAIIDHFWQDEFTWVI